MKTVGFFNVMREVGTTTLVYHLAWMYQEMGIGTVSLDLDPQADLTAAFFSKSYPGDRERQATICTALESAQGGSDENLLKSVLTDLAQHLTALPGDLNLSLFEDRFAKAWHQCGQGDPDAFRIVDSLHQIANQAARSRAAQLVLIDFGPGLSAINRAAFAACDYIVIPLRTNLSSWHSLRPLGSSLQNWRSSWLKRARTLISADGPASLARLEILGYVILQDVVAKGVRETLRHFVEGLSGLFHGEVLGATEGIPIPDPDPYCLAMLRRYPSLISLAKSAHKPMFLLKPADGAIGGYAAAVLDCHRDFKQLAIRIATAAGVSGF